MTQTLADGVSSTRPGALARAHAWLAGSSAPRAITLLAILLGLPALANGLTTDDRSFFVHVRQGGAAPLALFDFAAGRSDIVDAMRTGDLPWWASPDSRIRFFRPLSSLWHYVEFTYWPHATWLMTLQNIALYAACVWIASRLYRRLLPGRFTAGLASLLFAIDEGHASAVGWISSRNTVLCALLSLLCLDAHLDARQHRSRAAHLRSAAFAALALAAGEGGIACLAYLIAYAVVQERGGWRARLQSLAPQLAVIALWMTAYAAGGYGAHGTTFYRDLTRPLSVLTEGVLDLPLHLFSLFGISLASAALTFPPTPARLGALVLVLPLLVALARKHSWPAPDRFFALCGALCLPSAFATLAQDRVLFTASFGAFGLIASCLSAPDASASRMARGCLIACHLVISPLLFVPTLSANAPLDKSASQLARLLPETGAQSTVLVNAPYEMLTMYARATYGIAQDRPAPVLQALYVGASELSVTRLDARTLEVVVARGWGELPVERGCVDRSLLPRLGEQRTLGDMRVQVMEVNAAGRPLRVRFELDLHARQWLVWQGTRAIPWTLPAVGERVALQALSPWKSLPL